KDPYAQLPQYCLELGTDPQMYANCSINLQHCVKHMLMQFSLAMLIRRSLCPSRRLFGLLESSSSCSSPQLSIAEGGGRENWTFRCTTCGSTVYPRRTCRVRV